MNPSVIRANRQAIRAFSYALLPVIGGMLLPESDAVAQVISAGDDTNTTVTVVGEQFDITGGQSSADQTNTFHNFEQFDLNAEQTANFITSTEAQNVIGRINSDQYSSINGTLQVSGSNANLYLINPAGVLLGPEAQLNLAGGFTATTAHGIGFEDNQFATAATIDYSHFNGEPTAFQFKVEHPSTVVNRGELSIEADQSVNLIGGNVVNTGKINAPNGSVTVAAVEGESIVRISQNNQLLSLEVEPIEMTAINSGQLDLGEMLTGGQLTSATTVITNADGSIRLGADSEAIADHEHVITQGNGTALVSGQISTQGETGGNINVLGRSVELNNAVLNASGTYGGGLVRVGGDYKGQGSVLNALETTIDETSTLSADALEAGDGGNIFVWANETTDYSGYVSARGGATSGNGGFSEISGKVSLAYEGGIDLSAPQGEVGTLLLDPENVEITDDTVLDNTALHLTSAAVENIFNTSNLEISASNDIIIHDVLNNTISINQGRTMTFVADSDNSEVGEFRTGAGDRLIAPAGAVSITGASINIGSIDTSTSQMGNNSGDAGNISLNATGIIRANSLLASSSTSNDSSGKGGNIQVNSERGAVIIDSIESFSSAEDDRAGAAGEVNIFGSVVVLGNIDARSLAGDNNSASGGAVTVIARDEFVNITGDIRSDSAAASDAGSGGVVSISAPGEVSVSGGIISRSIADTDGASNAGSVTVRGENVTVNTIDSRSVSNNAGNDAGVVSLTAATRLTVMGEINATSESDGNDADIFFVGRLIDLLGGPISGNDIGFDTPDPDQDITVGLVSGGTPALDIFKRELDSISRANTVIIGREDSSNTITVTDYALNSTSSQHSIRIAGGQTLIGPNQETQYNFTGEGEGNIAADITSPGIAFSNIENIVGGNRDDVFLVTPGLSVDDFASFDGGAGNNTLDYAAFAGIPLIVDFGELALQNIQQIEGPAAVLGATRTLRGPDNNNTWTIDGPNSGLLNTSVFNNFETLEGGSLADTFSFEGNGNITGSIVGGGGTNQLNYIGYGSAISLSIDGQSVTGLPNFSDIQSVVGSSNTDTIIGSDNHDTFKITAAHTGTVNSTLNFSDIEEIAGEGGNNTLDYSQFGERITVDVGLMTASGLSRFSNINTVIGSQFDDDRLIGTTGNDDFVVQGDRTGTLNNTFNFSDIEILNGDAGDNTFTLNTFPPNSATTTSNLIIEGGNDLVNGQSRNLLTTDSESTTWQISGKNEGTLLDADSNAIAAFNDIQQIRNTSTTGEVHTVRFEQSNAQLTGGINSGDRDLRIVGNNINIGNSDGAGDNANGRIAGSGRLTIQSNDESVGIVIGGVDTQGTALNITAGEIAAIQEGFEDIRIGNETHTGGIVLGGDTTFRDAVRLRSQGDIDTRSGEFRTSSGSLSIETEGAILSDRLVSQTGDVTLIAGEEVTVESITAGGGTGINVSSDSSITANDTLNTSSNSFGDDVVLSANTDVRVGNIITSGSQRSGDVTIRSEQGSITTGGITTANNILVNGTSQEKAGSVLLESPGSIEVGFIDSRGNGLNTESSGISIATDDTFQATGTIDQPELSNLITGKTLSGGASISTVGARTGNVQIEYGQPDLTALRFTVSTNSTSSNSTAFRIETPQTAILSGDFLGSYTQENISLINRGIVPPTITASETATTVQRINFIETNILPSSIDLVFITEDDTDDMFTTIETRNRQAFSEYLGIDKQPIVDFQTAQNTLRELEQATDITPAVLYVYFVSDASSLRSVSSNQNDNLWDESVSPDDQLEVMIMTGYGEPVQRRQWGITRAQVEEVNQQLRQQATSQFSATQKYLLPAQQLYDWIVRPIADTLEQQKINSLGMVMDSSLRTMPISALHDGESFLVENYSLGVLPSFSLANIHSTVSTNRTDYSQERVLAMGASEFNNQPNLPAVSAEIELIAKGLGEGDAFLNEEFVLETLQTQIKKEDYGIVHLATHAVFEPGDLQGSYIQLWNEQLSLSQLGDLQLSEEEISLMILSACSTALGDRASEYGFAGLAVSAGSEAALASIWPVSDEGTLGFMTQFYEELRETTVRAEALRQTQIQMLRGEIGINDGVVYGPNDEILADLPALAESGRWDFSHPFYWSPFTMIGNPW